ncbi:MAG: methionine--tRNA ligase [Halobacteria archaeon]|nr:methionine--tRNA ligase [Halobacteria archaeon]
MTQDQPTVVTCALPYANGKAHLGHLRTYIPGDALTRSLRKLGRDVILVGGSDMHGTPIVVNSEEEGVEPEEFAMRYHEYFKETFPEIGVEFDSYGHTHQDSNINRTQEIVSTLHDEGYVYEDTMLVAYDPEEDRTLPDRYVEGTCPYCGEEGARGDECDECGRHLEPGEIEEPKSTISGAPAEYVEQEHYFFALSEFKEYLSGFIERLEGTSNAQNQPKQWIEEGLQDWCITRDMDWGVPFPEDGHQSSIDEPADQRSADDDLVLYVWVDAPIEYIASTEEWAKKMGDEDAWETYWRDDDSDIIHVIGGDIIQHHTVFWPAMLHGAGYSEPDAIMASGLVKINDKAFSTSRGRAVWLDDDYLDEGFDPDLIRYYIVSYTGFENDLNFSWDLFQERVNNELVGILGNFVYRSLLLTNDHFDEAPDGEIDDEVREAIEDVRDRFEDAIDDYDLKESVDAAMALAAFGNEYIQKKEPWHLVDEDPEEAGEVLFNCLQISKALALFIEPVMPSSSEEIWDQLREEGDVHDAEFDRALEPVSGGIDEPRQLFEKVSDDKVDELKSRLDERIGDEEGDKEGDEAVELEPVSDETVSFDDFKSLDLRVGEILSADPIEDSDKLVKLQVDIGVEERQLVAGVKQLHDVDDLEGQRIIVVANLEPTEIFGHESQGMLLAAGDEADLLTTVGDAEPGERVQ